jgi:hypothetical protein
MHEDCPARAAAARSNALPGGVSSDLLTGTELRYNLMTMRTLRLHITLVAALGVFGLTIPAMAADFGNPKDVEQVRRAVAAKFGHALHASVSHDWALCTAYSDESDVSVVLHRAGGGWKIVKSDGGAFGEETLKPLGIPPADIPALLKAYQ